MVPAGNSSPGEKIGIARSNRSRPPVEDITARSRPLRWELESGNLALVGSLGSGTTTALLALAAWLHRTARPDRCHLYAVDGGGDPAVDALDRMPHCGGVVRAQERERLARLLARLTDDLDARIADGNVQRPRVVLLIDRLGALRTALGTLDERCFNLSLR